MFHRWIVTEVVDAVYNCQFALFYLDMRLCLDNKVLDQQLLNTDPSK